VNIRKSNRRRSSADRRRRQGAAAIETAIVLMIFITLVFGMLDLGLGVLKHNSLSQAARRAAREAIVHGSMAEPLGVWGPTGYSGTAADTHPLAESVRRSLAGMDHTEVTVQAAWPEGGNDLEQQVTITASMPYRPIMAFIFGSPEFTLEAKSTMRIAH